MKTIITVEAQPGRTVPIHTDDNPNGGFVLLPPGERLEVVKSTTIRRCLRDGDLVEVTPAAAPASEHVPASAVEAPAAAPVFPTSSGK